MIYIAYALMTAFFVGAIPVMDWLAGYEKPKKNKTSALESAITKRSDDV